MSLGVELVEVGVVVCGQQVDVTGAEVGNAQPQVSLELWVGAVGEHAVLERMHLAHYLRYGPV